MEATTLETSAARPARETGRPPDPQIEGIIGQFTSVLRDIEGIVAGLDDAQFNWRPEPTRWSIGECFDHLNQLNGRYAVVLARVIQEARAAGRTGQGPFTYGFVGRYLLAATEPPVRRRTGTFKAYRPGSQLAKDAVMERFRETHEQLIALAGEASGLNLARIKVPSPVTSLLRLPLGMIFLLLAAHDRRHIWQARNVRNDAAFPAG
jgi:hypothetical protein